MKQRLYSLRLLAGGNFPPRISNSRAKLPIARPESRASSVSPPNDNDTFTPKRLGKSRPVVLSDDDDDGDDEDSMSFFSFTG